jgi:hypothetical protein
MLLTRHTIASQLQPRRLWPRRPSASSLRFFFLLSRFSTSFLYLPSATSADGLRTPGAPWSPLGRVPGFPLTHGGTSRYRVVSVSFYCAHTESRAPLVPFALLLSEDISIGPSAVWNASNHRCLMQALPERFRAQFHLHLTV